MNRQNVTKWYREFSKGRTDIHDEQKSGKPSLISDDFLQKTEGKIHAKRRGTIRELHHIIPEVSKTTIHEAVTEKLGYRKLCVHWVPEILMDDHKKKWMGSTLKFLMCYAQEGDERSNFHLFLHLKKHLAGKKFENDDEVQEEIMKWFKGQAADFYDSGIHKLVTRLNKCLDNAGNYVEKQSYVKQIHSQCPFCKLKELYMVKTFVSLLSGHTLYLLEIWPFGHYTARLYIYISGWCDAYIYVHMYWHQVVKSDLE
jgi:hypothetical protein